MEFLLGGVSLVLLVLILVGWVKNIIKIVKTKPFELDGKMIVRIIGIFIPIIGCVMGFIR